MEKLFSHSQHGSIRTELVDGVVWFCLKDICKMLDIKNFSECRSKLNQSGVKLIGVKQENQEETKQMLFITEDNISSCLFQSTKPEAEIICDWLFRSVLPQIKLYRDYSVDDLRDPEIALKFLNDYEDLRIRNTVMKTSIKVNAPKVSSINKLVGNGNCVDLDAVTHIIKYQGINRTEIFKVLRAYKVLDDSNIPYQEYCDKRYFRVVVSEAIACGSTIISKRTYVYPSGVTFIEKLLKGYEGDKCANS